MSAETGECRFPEGIDCSTTDVGIEIESVEREGIRDRPNAGQFA
jgi:hypothetical protein